MQLLCEGLGFENTDAAVASGNLEVVLYLESPPSEAELKELAALLDMHPIEFTRTKESVFKELGIDKKTVSPEAMIQHMANNPILIERPIVVKKDTQNVPEKAVLGRPPENVLAFF